jgi:acyl dehydratase
VTALATPALLLDQVTVGEQLPVLVYDVTSTTVVLGALAARDWRPMHHDYHFAVERQGVKDIFLNSPNQGAWLERFVTDWTGPTGRLGRLGFKMKNPVFPGDTMVIEGTVRSVDVDDTGCGWVEIDITIRVGDVVCTESFAKVAVPTTPDDNPWERHGDRWRP